MSASVSALHMYKRAATQSAERVGTSHTDLALFTAQLMHHIDQRDSMIDRCLRQDSVSQVEDMPCSGSSSLEYVGSHMF